MDNDQNKIKIERLYCCVIHYRLTSAWVTPASYPVQEAAVAYCGEFLYNPVTCSDENKVMQLDIYEDTLHFRITNSGEHFAHIEETIPYEVEKKTGYGLPLCDAMESWKFLISEHPIDPDMIMEGFQKGENGVYYNSKALEENERRAAERDRKWWHFFR